MAIGVVLAFRMQPESKFALNAADKTHVPTGMGV
jgi:hypothetical protein